jgi:hypothetical protein
VAFGCRIVGCGGFGGCFRFGGWQLLRKCILWEDLWGWEVEVEVGEMKVGSGEWREMVEDG